MINLARRVAKASLWVIFLGAMVYALAFATLVGFVTIYQPPELPEPAMIVVLSAGQKKDGSMGRNTASRVSAGISIYDPGDNFLVTGGRLRAHPKSIAEAMAEAAKNAGIDPLVEPRAGSTYANAVFSAQMIADQPDMPVILVTNRFHLPRSWLLFRNAGVDDLALYPAETAAEHWQQFGMRDLALETVKWFDAIADSVLDGW